MSETVKEYNFIKQVERTAKRDAYLTAIRYVEEFGLEHGLRILRGKAKGHTEFLKGFQTCYDYASQTLVPKKDGIDGEKVDLAMRSLSKSISDEISPPQKETEK